MATHLVYVLLVNYWIMAIASILISQLQHSSILKNPRYLNQSILSLDSDHAISLLRILVTISHHSSPLSPPHSHTELSDILSSWMNFLALCSLPLCVSIERYDFLFTKHMPCFYGTVPLLILCSPPIVLHLYPSKFYPSVPHRETGQRHVCLVMAMSCAGPML